MGGLSVNTNPNRQQEAAENVCQPYALYLYGDVRNTITSWCLTRVVFYASRVTKVFPIYGLRQFLVVVIQGERLLDFRRVPAR